MDAPTWPKRLYSLDITRGIAAVAVLFWHWQHFVLIGSNSQFKTTMVSWFLYFI